MALGSTLKKIRKQQGLSQKTVCQGICAQSMLSAVENNRYVPNAELLIKLCKRLSVSLDEFSLAANFAISSIEQFNQTVETLCNQHEYAKLKAFLLKDSTLDQVETAAQTQAYYYYLGIAKFQADHNLDDAQADLEMAISSAEKRAHPTSLTRLGLISLAVIKAELQLKNSAIKLVAEAMEAIGTAPYEENLNVVFYLSALISYKLQANPLAFHQVNRAITFITRHNSHYMLANCYRLIAQIAADQGAAEQQLEATERQKFLTDLFDEQVPDHF